ncbi:hypothetical protein FXO38_08227 [Capsicum annuum]|nr:hypothetical protein FXO38_08227 [Capsicum annuum]KAF3682055.1 hypothetical protein FXO37_02558 [Capsicum annuum]
MTAFQMTAPNRTLWVFDLQISAPNFQISAPNFSDLQKYLAATPEEYAKINYANNKAEYSAVITSLTAQRRHYLLMDFYDDMMLDGVKPGRDTFHSLLTSTMKGARLQDAFFFRDQSMIFIPDSSSGAPKSYVTSNENLIKNRHKKIRRKAKQAAQCFAGNETSLMTKAGQHTSASVKSSNDPLDSSVNANRMSNASAATGSGK